jgi:hypothetical protein
MDAFGIWGLIAAPFLATISESIIRQSFRYLTTRQVSSGDLDKLGDRHNQIMELLAAEEQGELKLELENLSQRLAELITDSQEATKNGKTPVPATRPHALP